MRYEDCSLWPFIEAKRLGKACVYDLPTCYYPAWEKIQTELSQKYSDWMPSNSLVSVMMGGWSRSVKKWSSRTLLLLPVGMSKRQFANSTRTRTSLGRPMESMLNTGRQWPTQKQPGPLRFIYAGNVSVRKGMALLIEAWSKAGLRDAELTLVGSWGLADSKLRSLPAGIRWVPPCSSQALRDRYRESHVFVFPSYSDGFGLVLLEAMACGLPAIASEASIGPEIITPGCGFITPTGDLDRLVELLRWFDRHRDELPVMGRQARTQAARCTWSNYRSLVIGAVSKLV